MKEVSQTPVTIFYSEHCPPCHACMEWMDQEGIPYNAISVLDAREQGVALLAVPTVIVGKEIIRGFQRAEIKKALGD